MLAPKYTPNTVAHGLSFSEPCQNCSASGRRITDPRVGREIAYYLARIDPRVAPGQREAVEARDPSINVRAPLIVLEALPVLHYDYCSTLT